MYALDHASMRQEKEIVWLGIAPIGIAWVFQAQVLVPEKSGRLSQHTHFGCEIVGYTDLADWAMPISYIHDGQRVLFIRRVFYLSPDWDHGEIPEDLPDDLVVTPDSISPGRLGDMPWDEVLWGMADDDEDEEDYGGFDEEDSDFC